MIMTNLKQNCTTGVRLHCQLRRPEQADALQAGGHQHKASVSTNMVHITQPIFVTLCLSRDHVFLLYY